MLLRPATIDDLSTLIAWVKDKDDCKLWAGPRVRFPLTLGSLTEDIDFSEESTLSMLSEGQELIGFGQLLSKEKGRYHMARLIVSPARRGKGFGYLLCRLLIEAGIKRYGAVSFSLNVYSDNKTAVKLYQKLGFSPETAPSDSAMDEEIIYMVYCPDH